MLSRKSKDKTSKTGLAGKYIKKDSHPEIKRKKCFANQNTMIRIKKNNLQ